MSQISACASSPTVQICADDCGAHAIALTQSLWLLSWLTGVNGYLSWWW